jgi:coproporphyrinogen III oxidase-like Fe-S oxidoreductase
MWLEMGESLSRAGLAHYVISIWARPGRVARHNVKYWTRRESLGLGFSAHELWAGRRRANLSSLELYLARLQSGQRPLALDEPIGEEAARREEIFLGLRLAAGVPANSLERWVGRAEDPLLPGTDEAWLEEESSSGTAAACVHGAGFLVSKRGALRFVSCHPEGEDPFCLGFDRSVAAPG